MGCIEGNPSGTCSYTTKLDVVVNPTITLKLDEYLASGSEVTAEIYISTVVPVFADFRIIDKGLTEKSELLPTFVVPIFKFPAE